MLDHLAMLKGYTQRGERRDLFEGMLRRVNLYDVRKKALSSFSGGMRQRVLGRRSTTSRFSPIEPLAQPRSNDQTASTGDNQCAEGKKYGATLYRDRRFMHSGPATYTFTVDKAPDTAGIDPFDLLIDRIPDDNTEPVTINSNGTAD